uniref:C-type lectin domain-containing protein n=1 Tax=Scleropages formosus TaxID=113540 RepID=A0A8C9S243_SCLFO
MVSVEGFLDCCTTMKKIALAAFLIAGLCAPTLSLDTEHFVISDNRNWDDAHSNCKNKYTELSSIYDEQEMEVLQTLSKKGWIGLFRAVSNSNIWNWTDGTNFSFQNWDVHQPDNSVGSENCVVENGWWNDYFCGVHLPSFCSQEMRKMVEWLLIVK